MMGSMWLLWIVLMFVLLVPPVGYGWGYRRWGPPYPTYVQRRRAQRAAAMDGSLAFDHSSWGMWGDFVWMVVIIGMVWAFSSFWWRWDMMKFS